MNTATFKALSTGKQLFASMWQCLYQHHPTETWAIHLKAAELKYQKSYYIWQTSWNWRNMNLITLIMWMTPSKACLHDFPLRNNLCWWLFVTPKPRRRKGHLEHDLHIHHLLHLRLRWNFLKNQTYISTLPGSSE